MSLETVACENCHLPTPKSTKQCIHCEKPRDIALPASITFGTSYRKPTQADIVAYNLWLQKTIAQ
jgi:hypothetical protein